MRRTDASGPRRRPRGRCGRPPRGRPRPAPPVRPGRARRPCGSGSGSRPLGRRSPARTSLASPSAAMASSGSPRLLLRSARATSAWPTPQRSPSSWNPARAWSSSRSAVPASPRLTIRAPVSRRAMAAIQGSGWSWLAARRSRATGSSLPYMALTAGRMVRTGWERRGSSGGRRRPAPPPGRPAPVRVQVDPAGDGGQRPEGQHLGPGRGPGLAEQDQRLGRPVQRLGPGAGQEPVPAEGGGQPQGRGRRPAVDGPAQGGMQVVALGGQPGDPAQLVPAARSGSAASASSRK